MTGANDVPELLVSSVFFSQGEGGNGEVLEGTREGRDTAGLFAVCQREIHH
ncbi:hypothetical protein AB7M26_001355 [Pseudomonas sp. F-14 TE3482]|jgi:hypothetical protein